MSMLNLALDLFNRIHPHWDDNEPPCATGNFPLCDDDPTCANCPKFAYSEKASRIISKYEDRLQKAYDKNGWDGIFSEEERIMEMEGCKKPKEL